MLVYGVFLTHYLQRNKVELLRVGNEEMGLQQEEGTTKQDWEREENEKKINFKLEETLSRCKFKKNVFAAEIVSIYQSIIQRIVIFQGNNNFIHFPKDKISIIVVKVW